MAITHGVKLDDACRIAEKLNRGEDYEPNTLDAFARDVRDGTLVIDVGCYSGLFAILAVKHGARAIGFEPFLNNRKQIVRNMKLNDVQFQLRPEAVSNYTGKGVLHFNAQLPLTAGASLSYALKSTGKHRVFVTRLDDVKLNNVSVVKIDVERHDYEVLDGARALLKRERPVVYAESLRDEYQERMDKLMSKLGYAAPERLDERNLRYGPVGA